MLSTGVNLAAHVIGHRACIHRVAMTTTFYFWHKYSIVNFLRLSIPEHRSPYRTEENRTDRRIAMLNGAGRPYNNLHEAYTLSSQNVSRCLSLTTIRCDTVYLTCSQNRMACSRISPPHGTIRKIKETSSSAVAKRPRDALGLSVCFVASII